MRMRGAHDRHARGRLGGAAAPAVTIASRLSKGARAGGARGNESSRRPRRPTVATRVASRQPHQQS
eukprot:scaffold15373_cov115-Isochrysis_galbana.AAC.3